jgi:hypothetical protein
MSSLIVLFSLLVAEVDGVSAPAKELHMWMTVGECRFAIALTDNAARDGATEAVGHQGGPSCGRHLRL